MNWRVIRLLTATALWTASARSAEPVSKQSPDDPLPPTGVEQELEEMRPGAWLKKEFDRIAETTNIRFGIAHTMLFQQATAGPGNRTAASGDLDLLAKWTAIGAGTKDTGILVFAGEYRYQIGDQPPSELGGEIGTLLGTTNSFGERPLVVKELYWDQRFFEDRLRFAVGRIDPENLFGGHRLQSANAFFLNKAFSTNPTVTYPGPSLAIAGLVKPVPWLYIDGGIADANGKVTTVGIDSFFDEQEYLTFTESGFTPNVKGLGSGRYRVALWHIDERDDAGKPSDEGITLSFDQEIGKEILVFLRYGYSDGEVTGVRQSVQGGVAFTGVLFKDDMLGLAAGWSEPESESKRDETVFEIFHRFQITQTMQFTVGGELIINPGNTEDDDVLGVFNARLRISI
jgi:porin